MTENKPPAVLYVEDDAQSRKLMKMLLTGRMKLPSVTIFEDSTDFLEKVGKIEPKPDIIFLDIHMKPITGFEMLKLLRDTDWAKNIPVVALTASVMHEEVQTLRSAGFNSCLAKPIDLNTFPDNFHRILAGEVLWRIID